MSIEAYKAVWHTSEATSSARTTLLAMADFASSQNRYTCRAAVSTLADLVKVSKRQIQNNIQALADLGEIRVIEGTGRGNYNVYDLKPLMLKHETHFALSDEKGEPEYEKGETYDTLSGSERVNSGTEKGEVEYEKGEPQYVKGEVGFDRTNKNQLEPEQILVDGFHEKTGLSPPHETDRDYEAKWLSPMRSIYGMCDGDMEKAEEIRDKSIELLWASEKYKVICPKSIVKTASNMVNSAEARASPNGAEPQDEQFEQMRRSIEETGVA